MRNSKGFTLIELLIVVVIIGILAAIAIPKFMGAKDKANVAVLKSDLRTLVTAEEMYFGDANSYGTTANLGTAFAASTGVTMAVTATATGYTATATHISGKVCTILYGTDNVGAGAEGVPVCT